MLRGGVLAMMNPLNSYKETTIRTAGQGKLIVMLYDECVRQLRSAEKELSEGQPKLDKINNSIIKAQDIITELAASLDLQKGGEIARNLMNLYIYFNQKLMEANLEKKTEKLVEVRQFMTELGEAWGSISSKVDSAKEPMTSSGINIAG